MCNSCIVYAFRLFSPTVLCGAWKYIVWRRRQLPAKPGTPIVIQGRHYLVNPFPAMECGSFSKNDPCGYVGSTKRRNQRRQAFGTRYMASWGTTELKGLSVVISYRRGRLLQLLFAQFVGLCGTECKTRKTWELNYEPVVNFPLLDLHIMSDWIARREIYRSHHSWTTTRNSIGTKLDRKSSN